MTRKNSRKNQEKPSSSANVRRKDLQRKQIITNSVTDKKVDSQVADSTQLNLGQQKNCNNVIIKTCTSVVATQSNQTYSDVVIRGLKKITSTKAVSESSRAVTPDLENSQAYVSFQPAYSAGSNGLQTPPLSEEDVSVVNSSHLHEELFKKSLEKAEKICEFTLATRKWLKMYHDYFCCHTINLYKYIHLLQKATNIVHSCTDKVPVVTICNSVYNHYQEFEMPTICPMLQSDGICYEQPCSFKHSLFFGTCGKWFFNQNCSDSYCQLPHYFDEDLWHLILKVPDTFFVKNLLRIDNIFYA